MGAKMKKPSSSQHIRALNASWSFEKPTTMPSTHRDELADILRQEIDREILVKLRKAAGWIDVPRPPDGWNEDALESWCSTNLPPHSWLYYGSGCLFCTKEQAILFQLTWT